jgi:hypothetical protein
MALDLTNLVNTYNGAVFLQPGAAEWGYVDPVWFLATPQGMGAVAPHVLGTSSFGANLNTHHFVKANYVRLVHNTALNNADKALFGTLLRMHAVASGLLDTDLARRGVIENEYSTQNYQGANWDDILNDIPAHNAAASIAAYVKKFGDTILQIMVYVFSARGHHWQEDYDALYDRLLSASGVTRPLGWQFPTNRELFRQILHCFGVRIPLEFVGYCQANNRISNPMRLRFVPHAPIAGVAQIQTMRATLLAMQSETWYGAFHAKFQAQIGTINAEVQAIDAHPYEYHVASRVLMGVPPRQLNPNALLAFTALAQYCLGYIDYLGRKHSLHGQQAITAKAGGMQALADTFSRACDKLGKPSLDGVTMIQFINNL